MSYIDIYSHSDVGQFLNFRVYHPFDKLDEEGYEIGPDNFLFGGGGVYGGGESKSFIFKNKLLCVFYYFLTNIEIYKDEDWIDDETKFHHLHQLTTKIHELESKIDDFEGSNFVHNFTIAELVKLNKEVKKAKVFYQLLFKKETRENLFANSTEKKLNIMAGEIFYWLGLVLFTKEELSVIQELSDALKSINCHPRRIYDVFTPSHLNWDCGGLIMYNDPNTNEFKQKVGNISYFHEKEIFESMEYKNRLIPKT